MTATLTINPRKLGGLMGAPCYGVPQSYISQSLREQRKARELAEIRKHGRRQWH